jgi:hypothetical protein
VVKADEKLLIFEEDEMQVLGGFSVEYHKYLLFHLHHRSKGRERDEGNHAGRAFVSSTASVALRML